MKPKKIILVRHGESEGNVNKTVYSQKPDYALLITEKGKLQAYNAGKELKNIIGEERVKFYISPLFRTRMTFENIAQHFSLDKISFIEEPRLREQEWGHLRTLEECIRVDKERDAFGTFYFRIPDGESAADVYDRVSDFFGSLHRDFEKLDYPENIVIVSHGMTIRLFLMRWFHWTVEEFEKIENPDNCQVIIMEKTSNNKYELITKLKSHNVVHGYQQPIQLQSDNSRSFE
ncbi:MAG: histidine phosphatase family protein [Bacteroidetes bacterium]|nr:histidine phosphatase family protein [Bacteroidota bacterium]